MSRSNRTGRGRLALPGLELYVTQAQGSVRITDANRVRTVDNIIDRAILVLESAGGRAVLSQLGRQIVSELGWQACLYPSTDPNLTYMEHYVDTFLRNLRAAFPVVIQEVMMGPESEFLRADWAITGSALEDFDPRQSGSLYLDFDVLEHIFTTRDNEARDTHTFLLIVSVTHELVHCFTGYLTGNARTATPPAVTVAGHGTDDVGEAGYGWEAQAFGGLVTMWGDPQRGHNQAGTPYLFEDHDPATPGTRIPARYIASFIAGDRGIRLPIQVSSREQPMTSRQLVQRGLRPMGHIRRGSRTPSTSGPASTPSPRRPRGVIPLSKGLLPSSTSTIGATGLSVSSTGGRLSLSTQQPGNPQSRRVVPTGAHQPVPPQGRGAPAGTRLGLPTSNQQPGPPKGRGAPTSTQQPVLSQGRGAPVGARLGLSTSTHQPGHAQRSGTPTGAQRTSSTIITTTTKPQVPSQKQGAPPTRRVAMHTGAPTGGNGGGNGTKKPR